ncbi:MAG: YHS domain-containing (seleno)protein, partial [Pseudomonadota bacterium]
KYTPAYGGYCAFGVSVGKKFVGDPEVWKIVDGKLYLNLDTRIQADWIKDIPGRIKSADKQWTKIASKNPAEL